MRIALSILLFLHVQIVYGQSWKLDSSFCENGIDTISIMPPQYSVSNSGLAVQDDRKIVWTGTIMDPTFSNGWSSLLLTVRLDENGKPDSSFSNDGLDTLGLGGYASDNSYGMALQPDHKIIHVGWSFASLDSIAMVVRIKSDGGLDSSFSDDGKVLYSFGSSGEIFSRVAVQTDGKIVCSGVYYGDYSDNIVVVTRLNPDGTPDLSFGDNGTAIIDVPSTLEDVESMRITSDNKILVLTAEFIENSKSYVSRLLEDGTPDSTFDEDGILKLPLLSSSNGYFAMEIDHENRIVLCGNGGVGNATLTIIRLMPDGNLDTSFGEEGFTRVDSVNLSFALGTEFGISLLVTPSNSIIVGGSHFNGISDDINDAAFVQIKSDGTIDSLVGVNGTYIFKMPRQQHIGGLALQDDDHLLLSGISYYSVMDDEDLMLIRMNDFPVGIPSIHSVNTSMLSFPNPASDFIHLSIQSLSKHAFISCYSSAGNLISRQEVNIRDGNSTYIMEVSSWPAGLYQVQVTDEFSSLLQAVMILR